MMTIDWYDRDDVPHESHKMGGWKRRVRTPGNVTRLYSVRECRCCSLEEGKHAAGHYMEIGLSRECLAQDCD